MATPRHRLLISIPLLVFLAGCTPQNSSFKFSDLNPFDDNSATDIVLNDAENSTTAPPEELLPEPVEDESCMVQELDALRQTGSWDTNQADKEKEKTEYDFPVVMNKQVEMYIDLFQHRQRKYFTQWLERSGAYMPLIKQELTKAGLPQDLAYLAMIESGFNLRAYSSASAVGMWQFMRGTGRDYSLRIDSYVDERRDPVKSTKAAVALLKDLHSQFNDWYLAVAAYNAGPGKIGNGLKRYGVDNFWDLAQKKYLRLETKRYVPKLIAAIVIAKNPEKYGFTNIAYAQPLQYDTIEVGPGLSLKALALVCGSSDKEVMKLNQELRSERTPLNQARYIARIPHNTGQLAAKNLERLHSVVRTGYKTHIKRSGETLTAICRRYNINKTTLLKVNDLRNGKLENGQRLRIPYSMVDYMLLPEDGSSLAENKDSLILHTIKRGETISKIAKRYGVPADMIVAWNGLKSVHKIREGQQLALYIIKDSGKPDTSVLTSGQQLASSKPAKSSDNIIVLSDSKKRVASSEAQVVSEEESFSWYQVKQGDTLWKISKKFNISTKEIKRWNNLDSNLIHPGSKLKLKDV